VPDDQIVEVHRLEIGGIQQGIAISGDPSRPALLILHGGGLPLPGVASKERYRLLADHFLLIFWDQRGTGISSNDQLTKDQFRLSRFVDDVAEITDYVKRKYNKDRIFLLGHSWGSMIALAVIQSNPQDYIAYIGVAQQINLRNSDAAIYKKLLDDPDTKQLKALNKIGPPPYDKVEDWLTLRETVARNNGLVSGRGDIGMLGLLARMLGSFTFNSDYSFTEPFRIQSRMNTTLDFIYDDMIAFNESKSTSVAIPVVLFHGSYDLNSDPAIARSWYDELKAPAKRFVEFDKSAHMIMWEQPHEFELQVINSLSDYMSN
jgi:pimeloyl-ACP methyl ester carboxylesterase